jgi:hypothetical protein
MDLEQLPVEIEQWRQFPLGFSCSSNRFSVLA